MPIPELVLLYERKIAGFQMAFGQDRIHGMWSALLLALAVAGFFALSLLAVRQRVSFLWPSLPIPLVAASAGRFRRDRRSRSRMWRLQRFYERALERVKGNWVGNGDTGEEFSDPAHIYSGDLNIFGAGSVFELLCTARTAIGKRGIAEYLLNTPAVEETIQRQEAVEELHQLLDLREKLATLGDFEVLESKWETFSEWLDAPDAPFGKPLWIITLVTSAGVSLTIIGGLLGLIPWLSVAFCIAPFVLFHSAVGSLYRERVNRMMAQLRPISVETQVLREGLHLLEQQRFQSSRLRQLSDQVRNSSKAVRSLERLLNGLHERNKEWFYTPSLLFLVATQLCMAVERWRIGHRTEFRIWLAAWAEFEALNALANYAFENPENTFPEFSGEAGTFEAEGLAHPLLPGESSVSNDIRLNGATRFYVISGSNMSGKSTLLRAIGLNAVLAFAGAPARARRIRLSRLTVCASISITDSLLNGKSKFMAEVDRLRQTLQAAVEGNPVLFLIDEIFAGTNSRDRRIAAEAVVRTLVNHGAIGALSTHDLALTEIAASDLCGMNVHTGSRDGSDPMDFDFCLKAGVTTETNALAIARMAGVPV